MPKSLRLATAWDHGLVTDPIPVNLDENERTVPRAGLLDWGGPANASDALAATVAT
jgi:hypothetical protein